MRLNQPVSYSSSVHLNIYTAFRYRANKVVQVPVCNLTSVPTLRSHTIILHSVIITNMSSDKAVVDSEPVAFTNEEIKQILHQFAKVIGSFELDFYNFDCFILTCTMTLESGIQIPCENDKARIELAQQVLYLSYKQHKSNYLIKVLLTDCFCIGPLYILHQLYWPAALRALGQYS